MEIISAGLMALAVAMLVVALTRLWIALVWRPRTVTKMFRAQGIGGPEYKLFYGSTQEIKRMKAETENMVLDVKSHDFIPRVHPHYRKWISIYGKTFVYWFGPQPTLCVTDMHMVKQVLSERTGLYPKNDPHPNILALIGRGLVFINGAEWNRHRKVVHPALTMDKLKLMSKTMADCALNIMNDWETNVRAEESGSFEIEIGGQFERITSDVIAHTAFGSSYNQGKQVFFVLKELLGLVEATRFNVHQVPGLNLIPTRQNRENWKLSRKIRAMLKDIVQSRIAAKDANGGYGNDLLGMMLEACSQKEDSEQWMSMDDIIDECKTFFFAGHDTTSNLLTWTAYLLSVYPEWQEKLREEVLGECGTETVPDADKINKLHLVNMVLLESLRLYDPVVQISRKASLDMKIDGINVPKGTALAIPIATIHRDKDEWGPDADEFNPLRFEHGVMKASKHPNALLSFSSGPRSCIGQNFAMIEAKIVITLMLQRFTLTLSPKYVHAPLDVITIHPKYGLPIILRARHESK